MKKLRREAGPICPFEGATFYAKIAEDMEITERFKYLAMKFRPEIDLAR